MPYAGDHSPEFTNFQLTLFEAEWRDLYFFLESHGYRLRPRYHPDWEPSWKRKNIEFYEAEDYIQFPVGAITLWDIVDDAKGMFR